VVVSVRSQPIPVPSVFPAEILSVSLADGDQLSLFVKHLGSEQAEHPDKQRRDREVRVYETLLRYAAELPVPRYYGSRWNAATQRTDVYLEYVPDWSLKYTDLEHWFTAAHRLAQLQAHFAARPERLLSCDFLLRLDGTGLLPARPRELRRLFFACELHQTMCRLAYFATWRTPTDQVADWVRQAERWLDLI
jgi:hypothetical protein